MMGNKGIQVVQKQKPSLLRDSQNRQAITISSSPQSNYVLKGNNKGVTLRELSKIGTLKMGEGDMESKSFSKDFADFMGAATVALTWGSAGPSSATGGVNVTSPLNYFTWSTTTTDISYSGGFIVFTFQGVMSQNITVGGSTYSWPSPGTISGEYHVATGQSAINVQY